MSQRSPQKQRLLRNLGTPTVLAVLLGTVIGRGCALLDRPIEAWIGGTHAKLEACEAQLKGWEFSEALFKLLPSDVDFLVRQVAISKESGAAIEISGPQPEDSFKLRISQIISNADGTHSAVFSVEGMLANVVVMPKEFPLRLVRSSVAGPINLGNFELYVFVDNTNIDHVQLSVARRPFTGGLGFSNLALEAGVFRFHYPRPRSILISSPTRR